MPRLRPNRKRDYLRRLLEQHPNEPVSYTTLGNALFPAKMLNGEITPAAMLTLTDLMRCLREELRLKEPEMERRFITHRGIGYMYEVPSPSVKIPSASMDVDRPATVKRLTKAQAGVQASAV